MKKLLVFLCGIVLLCASGISMADSPDADDWGSARSVTGHVVLVRGGESMPLPEGGRIVSGDRIETDSAGVITIVHPDGGTLHVGPSSSVVPASLGRLNLAAGIVRVRAKGMYVIGLPGGEEVRVSSADSDFAVKYMNRRVTIVPLRESVFFRGRLIRPGTFAQSHMGRAPQVAALTEEDEMNFFEATSVVDTREAPPLGYSLPAKSMKPSKLLGQVSSILK